MQHPPRQRLSSNAVHVREALHLLQLMHNRRVTHREPGYFRYADLSGPISQLAFAAVVQPQGFVQPVENNLVFVRELAGLTMIFGPIFDPESDNLLRNLQRIVDLLRLAVVLTFWIR